MSPTLVQRLAHDQATPSAAPTPLTKREQQVLALLLQGQSNGAIAEQLHLSRQTVRNYVHGIYQKFQVNTRVELLLLLTNR